MKTIKHSMSIILVLVVAIALAVGIEACAKTVKASTGRLLYYEYHFGGGMNPLNIATYHLRYEGPSKEPTLTVSGDCEGETITFKVEEEVFDRLAKIIKEHKLYRSKGFYKPKYEVLDAPSAGFSFCFEGDEFVSGSGDWPKNIEKGVAAANAYLHSLRGNRKAAGHVDRIYGGDDLPGMIWTDGTATLTTTDTDASELKRHLRSLLPSKPDHDALNGMGYSRFHDGDQHYILIHDYNNKQHRLYYSFDGKPETLKKMKEEQVAALKASKPAGRETWPIVNERFLSHPMLELLSTTQLKEMINSIRLEKVSPYGSLTRMTDVGEVNHTLLVSEQHRREKQK